MPSDRVSKFRCVICHEQAVQSRELRYFRGNVYCEECKAFSHGTCLQKTYEEVQKMDYLYYCPKCTIRREGTPPPPNVAVPSAPKRSETPRPKRPSTPKSENHVVPEPIPGPPVWQEGMSKEEHNKLVQAYAIGEISDTDSEYSVEM